jgi:hypothetical protein
VDIDDPIGKATQKRRSENEHPAGEDEQVWIECQEHVGKLKVICLAGDGIVTISEW